jgi:hypothetical protein
MPANFNLGIVAEFTSAAAGNDNFTMIRAGRVYDAFARANAAAAGTCTVNKGSSAITNAMDVSAAVNTIARAEDIDPAQDDLVAGDTLRVVKSVAPSTSTYIYIAADGVSA